MIGKASPARREGLIRACHKLIQQDREAFTIAGQRLGEIFSDEYARSFESTPETVQPRQLLFIRLHLAKFAAIGGDSRPGMTDMLFEEPMLNDDRKHAARLVVLTLLLAMDPMDDGCVSPEMCPLAALPWACGDMHGKNPDYLGRSCIPWEPSEDNSVDSPPAEVLDLLERAKWSAQTGKVWEPWMYIPNGDGMPCVETGTNKYDELWRAMRDVCRHVGAFSGNAHDWADVCRYERGKDLSGKKSRLLEYNRGWWESWEPALQRARDAGFIVQLPYLQERIGSALDGLAQLSRIFSAPLMGNRGEHRGDHLFRRGPLGCTEDWESKYPSEAVQDACRPILKLIESLELYLDGSVDEKNLIESKLEADDQGADFRPISSFPAELHARIRQAVLPGRKSKRVRKRKIDGVNEYSFTDAKRWWPGDFRA